MDSLRVGWYERHQQHIEWGMFTVFLALLSYSTIDALALLPSGPSFKPWQTVSIYGALLIQSVGNLVQRRVPWASIALLALALVVLVGGFAIAR